LTCLTPNDPARSRDDAFVAVIFKPCGVSRMLVAALRQNEMVPAADCN